MFRNQILHYTIFFDDLKRFGTQVIFETLKCEIKIRQLITEIRPDFHPLLPKSEIKFSLYKNMPLAETSYTLTNFMPKLSMKWVAFWYSVALLHKINIKVKTNGTLNLIMWLEDLKYQWLHNNCLLRILNIHYFIQKMLQSGKWNWLIAIIWWKE